MTPMLVGLLVVLIGGRLQIRPRPRRPQAAPLELAESSESRLWPLLGDRRLARRPFEPGPEHVAAWCDALARAVGGGATLATAIRTVEPPAACVAAVGSIRLALERGVSLHDACSSGPQPEALQVAITVIRACAAQGGPAAEPLSRTAAVLRGRAADAAERRTQSAQARMSAIVMTILPICMLALLLATSSSVRLFVVSPTGLGVMAAGAALNTLGWRWMRRLVTGGRP
jgi:tight adherence protein B